MKVYYVTFRSVTYAQRGQASLTAHGIDCTIRRTPKWMEKQGCGYSLQISRVLGLEAVQILRREGVEFRKVYLKREDGTMEEVLQ